MRQLLCLSILLSASIIFTTCTAEAVSFGFGGGSVATYATYPDTSQGSISTTSTLTLSGSGTSLVESTTASDIVPIEETATNGYETVKLTYYFDPAAEYSALGVTKTITDSLVEISQSYSIAHADRAILTAYAINRKGYTAEVKADIVNGQVGKFSHDSLATPDYVSARQLMDDAAAQKITRTLSARAAYMTSSSRAQTSLSGGTIPVMDYEDSAYASRTKATCRATSKSTGSSITIPTSSSSSGLTWPDKPGFPSP